MSPSVTKTTAGVFARYDTGEFGPWDTRGWIAASTSEYDKFKGPGDLEKRQFNAKLAAGHWR